MNPGSTPQTSSDTPKALTIQEVSLIFEQALLRSDTRRDHSLHVRVFSPGKVGGLPTVAVTDMHIGFDWDAGKVLVETSKPLTVLSPEDVAAIHKSAKEGQSWHVYQQYTKLDSKIKAQSAELEQLKQELADAKQAARWESDLAGQALKDLDKAKRWISVETRLPEESETLDGRVAALDTDGIMVNAVLAASTLITSSGLEATHWIPSHPKNIPCQQTTSSPATN